MNIKLISFLLITGLFLTVSCNSQNAGTVLNPAEFNKKINTTSGAIVLDVRTPEEFAGGYIANAVNINYNGNDFQDEIAKLDKNRTYFVYCLSGKRSASAASYMRSKGFRNVINLDGGILAWQANNLPLTTTATIADEFSYISYKQMITSDTTVLVDFYAPWCAPCMKMKPMLEQIAQEYTGRIKLVRLDISKNKDLAKQLNIVEIPLFKIIKKGNEVWSHQGTVEKEELIKQF